MIYTFYSFKGGVGRSMALANVARWFYDRGLHVLMVDWDLEAPGLETFFEPPLEDGQESVARSRPEERLNATGWPGVIDMLLQYKRVHSRLPLPAKIRASAEPPPRELLMEHQKAALTVLREHLSPIRGMLHALYPPQKDRDGSLWLLPAGLRAGHHFADYAHAVQSFDWADFYTSFHGEAYFNWLREQFKAVADVILVDARTGVTEMGGVCARQLADVVVSFCSPNDQNLKGIRMMVRSFVRQDVEQVRQAPLEVVVVPSRVDWQDSQQYQQFEQEFRRTLADIRNPFQQLEHSFWDLKIPYITKYAYKEELAIGQTDGVGKELGDAYRTLALHLVMLAPEGSALRTKCARDLQERFPQLVPSVGVAYAGESNRGAAELLCSRLMERHISIWQGGDLESPHAQQLASVLPYLRHAVVAVSDQTVGAEALRNLCHEARQRGVWLHLVHTGPSRMASAVPLPLWLPHAPLRGIDDVEGLASLLGTRTPAPRVPHMAPLTPPGFVMRAEVATVKDLLLSSEAAPSVIALWGIGGSGKTTLAAAVCSDEEVQARFNGGVLWATLGPQSNVGAQFEAMIAALSGESVAPAAAASTAQREPKSAPRLSDLMERLDKLTVERRTLLVLDDVTSDDQASPILYRYQNWTVILTTRDCSVDTEARVIPLGGMSRDEARTLLTAGLSELSPEDEQHVEAICQAVSSLPLPLALARSILQGPSYRDQSISARLAALVQVLQTEGPFASDRPATASEVPPGAPSAPLVGPDTTMSHSGLERSRSVAMTIADCLRRLPWQVQSYLAWIASHTNALPLQDVQVQFKLSQSEVIACARMLRNCALAEFDEPSGVLRAHPLVRAYFVRPQPATPKTSVIDTVRDILRGKSVPVAEMLERAIQLRQESHFGLARRLLQLAHRDPGFSRLPTDKQLKLVQQLALCTYKDPDLPAYDRLERALELLTLHADLKATMTPETLGLAGAIYKRKWEVEAQKQHLEYALAYYLRGYGAARPESQDYDFGYTAINASFLLDLLADQEDASQSYGLGKAEGPAARRLQAQRIREELRTTLPPLMEGAQQWLRHQWWFYATLAEACFGLRRYDEARDWIAQGRVVCFVPDWELESTARQLATLAHLSVHTAGSGSNQPSEAATSVLRDLLDGNEQALRRTLIGKVGLALSGGGFRASLFHIGVLARLADLDVLRSVEVLSCVSGGSIIGAHYYLEVRHLLQSKADHEITREDYINIVHRIAHEFLAGVQTNIRTSVMADLKTSLQMIFDADYSRTERLGELYEERLFSRVPDSEGDRLRYLSDLFICPVGIPAFNPKTHNWRRAAKAPILILNATTLNTGHNWQFTASFMGESPSRIDTRIDGNERLRRMYYSEAPDGYQRMRLGRAVAASACVPGLFEPLVFKGLYPDRVVRLVDGGVHDNQGVAGLLEQDCTVLLVSDASGQMQTLYNPPTDLFGVPLRTNSVLQARLRTAQYQELDARQRSALLRGLMFIHLKKDLDVDPINWVQCEDPIEASDEARPAARRGVLTSYGIRKDVQEKLAAIRTDLDSFSDLEAYALMVSGYRMTEYEFHQCISGFNEPQTERPDWPFFAVEEEMRRERGTGPKYNRLMSVLETASRSVFKLWTIPRRLQVVWASVSLLLPLVLVYLLLVFGGGLDRFWALTGTAIVAAITLLVYWAVLSGFAFRGSLYGLSIFPAWLHVRFFDRRYLRAGWVERPADHLPARDG